MSGSCRRDLHLNSTSISFKLDTWPNLFHLQFNSIETLLLRFIKVEYGRSGTLDPILRSKKIQIMYQYSYPNIFTSIWSNDFKKVEHVVENRGGGVCMAINNFPRAHTIVYEGKVEKWVPSGNGKTDRQTKRFPKKDQIKDQI